ncbi:MAG TPA: FecR domain-containing protein [Burkholderiales bacterium]|nr:FecR domain-containing protein [Burkholderiales bacterium]
MGVRRGTGAARPLRAWCLALALLGLIGAASPAGAQEQGTTSAAVAAPPPRVAGTIELAAGDSMIEAQDGKARLPKVGDSVSEGDTIVTFAQGELHVHMADGAYLSVRENSRLKIAAYVADGGKNDTSVLELVQGSLRSVTGWIGKFNRAAYQVKTPTVTIGVRGTDHEPTVIPVGDPRGEPGTYDKVNEGRTFMRAGSSVLEVGANQAAFHPHSGGARPRVLASVPAFFKPTVNEQRFVARSREVRETVDTRRLERQEAVRRGAEGRREGPGKAAPAAPRPGVQPKAVRPGAREVAPRRGPVDAPKGEPQRHRAIEREKARAARPVAKPGEEAGERAPAQGAGRHRR